jgi:EmrB/QacA subfamily drug resistance transporter
LPAAPSAKEAPDHPRLILATCILASSLAFVDGSVLNVALPTIARGFHAATDEVQWVVNAFLLPLSALLLIGGAAGDLYGRRRLLIGGIFLFAAASLICAVAHSLALLLSGRALQGLGAAMLLPSSLALLGAAFDGERRGRAVGIWAAAGAVAGAIAPLIGGWLIDLAGWRWIFLINLPIAAAAILLAFFYAPESANPDRPPPDWAGAALATAALGALTWGLTAWSASGRAGFSALAAIGAGLIVIPLFLRVEHRRREQAMVPLSMFGSASFVGLTLLTLLLYGAFGGIMILLPYTLIEAGYSSLHAGAAMLPLPILIAAFSPWMGRIASRIGPRLPLTAGPAIVAVGFLLALRIRDPDDYWGSILPMVLILSIGMAVAVAPLTTAVLASVDRRHTGTASGLNSAVARTGGLIATALLGAVLARRGPALITGFHFAAIAAAAASLAAAFCAFVTLRKPSDPGSLPNGRSGT